MLLLVIIMCQLHALYGVQEVKFYSGVLCDLEARLGEVCSKPASNFNTLNACVLGCSQDPECVGASVVNKTKCFHHQTCNTVTGCIIQENEHRYMSKKCAHGGVWNPVTSACTCVNGWVGDHCLDLPSKCHDLINLGRYSTDIYRTYLTLENSVLQIRGPFPVVCYINAGSDYSQVRVFSNSGYVNFSNRTWQEYKDGFFVDSHNFWVGLNNMHVFSVAGYTNLVMYVNDATIYREYFDFHIEDESRGFSFSIGVTYSVTRDVSSQNTFPDCLGPLQNSPFSTTDNDRDGVIAENCAQRVGGGWWFSGESCSSPCNLLGKSPREWALFPSDQWMRLDGTDSALLRNAGESPEFIAYLKHP